MTPFVSITSGSPERFYVRDFWCVPEHHSNLANFSTCSKLSSAELGL